MKYKYLIQRFSFAACVRAGRKAVTFINLMNALNCIKYVFRKFALLGQLVRNARAHKKKIQTHYSTVNFRLNYTLYNIVGGYYFYFNHENALTTHHLIYRQVCKNFLSVTFLHYLIRCV